MNPFIMLSIGAVAGLVLDRMYFKVLRKPTPEIVEEIRKRVRLALKERGYDEMTQQELRDKRSVFDEGAKVIGELLKQKRLEARARQEKVRPSKY